MAMKLLKSGGSSVLEIIIALAVLSLSMAAVSMLSYGSQSLTLDSGMANQAALISENELENAELQAKGNFQSLKSTASAADGVYSKRIEVDDISQCSKRVKSLVNWSASGGRNQALLVEKIVTDISGVLGSGDTCPAYLPDTPDIWRHPTTYGQKDIGPSSVSTGIDVVNSFAYISSTSPDPAKSDLFVFNVSDGAHPIAVSDINTGPGLNGIDVAGSYAYAANSSASNNLQVIRVADPSHPYLLSSVSAPGGAGKTVFYADKKAYLGTVGGRLDIIDVSHPASPWLAGSLDIGGSVNKIYVSGHIAYLATSVSGAELAIIDVSNPSHPAWLGKYDAPAGDAAQTLFVLGNRLYLGRKDSSSGVPNLIALDISNPSSPFPLGSVYVPNANIDDIYVLENLAFVLTDHPNGEFQIWNIKDPANMTLYAAYNFPEAAVAMDYENDLAYCAIRSNDGLRVIKSN